MSRRHFNPWWRLLPADVLGIVAAGMEVAATGQIGGVGRLALQYDPFLVLIRLGLGHGRQQGLGVRLAGHAEDALGRTATMAQEPVWG